MGSYKKIGLSHEIGLIDTPPFHHFIFPFHSFFLFFILLTLIPKSDVKYTVKQSIIFKGLGAAGLGTQKPWL